MPVADLCARPAGGGISTLSLQPGSPRQTACIDASPPVVPRSRSSGQLATYGRSLGDGFRGWRTRFVLHDRLGREAEAFRASGTWRPVPLPAIVQLRTTPKTSAGCLRRVAVSDVEPKVFHHSGQISVPVNARCDVSIEHDRLGNYPSRSGSAIGDDGLSPATCLVSDTPAQLSIRLGLRLPDPRSGRGRNRRESERQAWMSSRRMSPPRRCLPRPPFSGCRGKRGRVGEMREPYRPRPALEQPDTVTAGDGTCSTT